MSYDLKGKVVLVTGGASGIGFSCVKELLKNGVQGVTIADMDDTKGKLALKHITEEFGSKKVVFVKTDVTKASQFEAAFKKTTDTWKTIDVVINNAGICNDGSWELEIAVNAGAVVRGTLLGLQYMRKDNGGRGGVIINMASVLGLEKFPCSPIYTATKHFVVGLSRSLGSPYHYSNTGVKIVTMCPGLTTTTMPSTAPQNVLTTLAPDIAQQLEKEYAELPPQPPEHVARGIITLITKGCNGSVWVAEANEPVYEVEIPDRKTIRKL